MNIIAIACTVLLGIAGRLCVIWARQEPSLSLGRSHARTCNKTGKKLEKILVFFFNGKLTAEMVSL